MYVALPHFQKVIGNFRRSLIDGGSLAESPSEASKALFPQFATANITGAVGAPPSADICFLVLAGCALFILGDRPSPPLQRSARRGDKEGKH